MEENLSVNASNGRLSKKVHRRLEEPPDLDDPMVDGKGVKVNLETVVKGSWKDMLLGNSAGSHDFEKEEEFVLADDDAKQELVNGVTNISFSE